MASDPPSVAHVLLSFGFGGAEVAVAGMAARARARGERVRIELPLGGACAAGVERLVPGLGTGVRVPQPDTPSRAGALRLGLHAAASTRDADIVHLHLPWPDRLGVGLVGRGRRPALATFHLLPEGDDWSRDLGLPRPLAWTLAHTAPRLAPIVLVAVSQHDAGRLRARYPRLRVQCVPNCPQPPTGRPAEPLPWGPGLRLLAVGRLCRQKGFDRLLAALGREPMRQRSWTLCIVGEGEERPALEQQRSALGLDERVHLVGARSAPDLYPQAELFVSSSRSEGMPLCVLEAMQAGVAVCVSSIPSHQEVAGDLPEALLGPDEAGWPAALARIAEDPATRARSGALARERVQSRYSAERQDAAYGALYRELAREGGST